MYCAAGSLENVGDTGEQRAFRAWLAAQTPAGGQAGLTPGNAMLTTPHLQGLLQQLRISTPSLGAQVPSQPHITLTDRDSSAQASSCAVTELP